MNNISLAGILILLIIGLFYNKQFKRTIEMTFIEKILGERPEAIFYTEGESDFDFKLDILKYELEKTRLFYTIIFLLIIICFIALQYNQQNLYDKTTQALYKKGIIDFINNTYMFQGGY